MARGGRGHDSQDELEIGSLSDNTVAVLRALGVAGTVASIQYRLEFSDQVSRFINRYQLNVSDNIPNVRENLIELEKGGLIKYERHGIWQKKNKKATI